MSFAHKFEFENEADLKLAFARLYVRYNDPFKAALDLFPGDVPRALWVAMNWANDPDVVATKAIIVDAGDDLEMLPNKADAARLAWQIAEDKELQPFERIAALKLYMETRGFIDKPVNQTNVVVNENKVMLVTDHGSSETWEEKCAQQQARLLNTKYLEHDATAN